MSYVQTEDYLRAIQELEACRRLDPAELDLVFHLGHVYGKVATQGFQAVRRAGMESPWLFLLRGQMFARQGDAGRERLRSCSTPCGSIPAWRESTTRSGMSSRELRVQERPSSHTQANLTATPRISLQPQVSFAPSDTSGSVRKPTLSAIGRCGFTGTPPWRKARSRSRARAPTDRGPAPRTPSGSGEPCRTFGRAWRSIWTERSLDALHAGNPEAALEIASGRLDDGSADEARYWQARAHLALGQAGRALQELLPLQSSQPGNPEFAYFLQTCAERLARESLELFAAREPASYRTHHLRAEYLAARDDVRGAIEEYAKALALAPGASASSTSPSDRSIWRSGTTNGRSQRFAPN